MSDASPAPAAIAPYEGRAGQTRTERVHLVEPDGSVRSLDMHRVVNVYTHPDLKRRVLDGDLHRAPDGRELALPFVYHDPLARKLALVIPSSLAHLEMKEWTRLMAEVGEDTECAVPTYVREGTTVLGLGALALFLGEPLAPGVESAVGMVAPSQSELALVERERALVERERGLVEREQRLAELARTTQSESQAVTTARADLEVERNAQREARAEIEQARLHLVGERVQLEHARKHAQDERAQLEQAKKQVGDDQGQLDQARQELLQTRREVEEAQLTLTLGRTELEQQRSQLEQIKRELEQQQKALERIRTEQTLQQGQMAQARAELEAHERRSAAARAELDRRAQELISERAQLEQKERELSLQRSLVRERSQPPAVAAEPLTSEDDGPTVIARVRNEPEPEPSAAPRPSQRSAPQPSSAPASARPSTDLDVTRPSQRPPSAEYLRAAAAAAATLSVPTAPVGLRASTAPRRRTDPPPAPAEGPGFERSADLRLALRDPERRREAIRELCRRGHPTAVVPIFTVLPELPPEAVATTVVCLLQLGEAVADGLVDQLGSGSQDVRHAAALGLGQLRVERTLAPLVHQIQVESTPSWAEMARALGDFGPLALPYVVAALPMSDRRERLMVGLAYLASAGCLEEVKSLESAQDPTHAMAARQALSRCARLHADDVSLRTLQPLRDQSPETRFSQVFFASLASGG